VKVFVAGATGVLGEPLVRALVAAGHEVIGTSRTAARAASVDAAGAHGVVCDALDRDAVFAAVSAAAPEVVVHQLTALPANYVKLRKGDALTERLRSEGTRHLVDAAVSAGARRVIAESIAFLYALEGPPIATEESAVMTSVGGPAGGMLDASLELERTVLSASGIEGVVLRYGALYGPGTYYGPGGDITRRLRVRRWPIVGDGGGLTSFLHVDDAAAATMCALSAGGPGIYNVVDDAPAAAREWQPELAALLGAKPPRRVPRWLVRAAVGSAAAAALTEQRGASNAKAKSVLGWTPRYPSWRDGFRAELG
jgi:nucleoside-diphosphate-sugar epimerase